MVKQNPHQREIRRYFNRLALGNPVLCKSCRQVFWDYKPLCAGMDFIDLLIVIIGLSTAAFIAALLAYAIGTGLVSVWSGITHHRERARHALRTTCGIGRIDSRQRSSHARHVAHHVEMPKPHDSAGL